MTDKTSLRQGDPAGGATPQSACHTGRFATSRPSKKIPQGNAKEPQSHA